MIWDLGHRP